MLLTLLIDFCSVGISPPYLLLESLRRKYCEQAEELTSTRQEQLEEEGDLTGECGDPIREGVESGDENPFDGEFPDVLVPRLAALVQGRCVAILVANVVDIAY